MATPIVITYVTAPGCHFCEHGRDVLDALAGDVPVEVREVDLQSEEGRELAARWRVPYPPMVLADDRLIGYGRLSARRLSRRLAEVPR
jgi:thiol-disulfide isomerase/thioredoxin